MIRIGFIVLIGLLAIVAGCTSDGLFSHAKTELAKPHDDTLVRFDPAEAFSKLNATRKRHFLNGFHPDKRLMEAAQRHAETMGRTGKFGHDIGPGTKFQKRLFSVGFRNSAGENLGVGYRSIDAAIEGWLNSPGHRKILLKRRYNLGGIAYARNTSGKNPRYNHFWVLIVGQE